MISRAAFSDFITDGHESAVLIDDRLIRLGPIATVLIAHLEQPKELAELVEIVVANFGEPPTGEATSAVRDQLATLASYGLINDLDGTP